MCELFHLKKISEISTTSRFFLRRGDCNDCNDRAVQELKIVGYENNWYCVKSAGKFEIG